MLPPRAAVGVTRLAKIRGGQSARGAAFKSAIALAMVLSCMGLVPGGAAATPRPVTMIDGHRLELVRWLDPLSSDCENARLGKRFGLMQAVNTALDRTERDSTRWWKAWLECPDDTLPWQRRAALMVTLKDGREVVSRMVMAAGEGMRFLDYYPGSMCLPADRLHMLVGPRGIRSALLLIGFPPTPAFEASDVATLTVKR